MHRLDNLWLVIPRYFAFLHYTHKFQCSSIDGGGRNSSIVGTRPINLYVKFGPQFSGNDYTSYVLSYKTANRCLCSVGQFHRRLKIVWERKTNTSTLVGSNHNNYSSRYLKE